MSEGPPCALKPRRSTPAAVPSQTPLLPWSRVPSKESPRGFIGNPTSHSNPSGPSKWETHFGSSLSVTLELNIQPVRGSPAQTSLSFYFRLTGRLLRYVDG